MSFVSWFSVTHRGVPPQEDPAGGRSVGAASLALSLGPGVSLVLPSLCPCVRTSAIFMTFIDTHI